MDGQSNDKQQHEVCPRDLNDSELANVNGGGVFDKILRLRFFLCRGL